MVDPAFPAWDRPRATRTPLLVTLLVVLPLATIGSFGAAFGVMTQCTDDYSCTDTRGVQPRAMRLTACGLAVVSVLLFTATTSLARTSF
jgi:hypothetical protein